MELQQGVVAEGHLSTAGDDDLGPVARSLADAVQPWFVLHDFAWERFVETTGREGWYETMRQLSKAMAMSVPTLETAAVTGRQLGLRYGAFTAWCDRHAAEERDHDRWLLDDLDRAGVASGANEVADPAILALMGTQLMLARSVQPTGILGYAFVTECHPSTPEGIDDLQQLLGLPDTALTTLRYHVRVDPDHRREVLEQVELYGQDSAALAAMVDSAAAYLGGWTSYFGSAGRHVGAPSW